MVLSMELPMSRSQRLLDLIQLLRRHRRPVAGAMLAAELGVSLRTLYRDIEALKAQGASIDGEAGVGYVLRPGFMLPPLMFTRPPNLTRGSLPLRNSLNTPARDIFNNSAVSSIV